MSDETASLAAAEATRIVSAVAEAAASTAADIEQMTPTRALLSACSSKETYMHSKEP